MNRLCLAMLLAVAVVVSATAMEKSAGEDFRSQNAGVGARFEALRAELTAAFNALTGRVVALEGVESRVDTLETRVNALDAALTALRNDFNGFRTWATNAINGLLARVSALEARSSAAQKDIVYTGTFAANSNGSVTASNMTFCALTKVYTGTVEDNHNHTCDITRSGTTFTLTARATKSTTQCEMDCYRFQ